MGNWKTKKEFYGKEEQVTEEKRRRKDKKKKEEREERKEGTTKKITALKEDMKTDFGKSTQFSRMANRRRARKNVAQAIDPS